MKTPPISSQITSSFQKNLNHRSKGILATESAPIVAAEVGRIEFVNPSGSWKINTDV